ncbi:MAG: GH116 family glycosyl-hydrolase [Armatimonadetes bacterium]|nr:GH116 family glycosyl-hydrolase [Armatimonadota bacterium]
MENAGQCRTLFPTNLPPIEYTTFQAEGFSVPVSGVVYSAAHPATCGVPLGGIDTGCLDLETNGTFGLCTLFNSIVPRRGPLHTPFLGISVGKRAWTLTTDKLYGVDCAKEIRYWGHYPIADMEYILDAPVSVGLRAWSPFIPGDIKNSNIPVMVFEVRVRNNSKSEQAGSVVFSFPGALLSEMMRSHFYRQPTSNAIARTLPQVEARPDRYNGVLIHAIGVDHYIIGTLGSQKPRLGGKLGFDGPAWAKIPYGLPVEKPTESGASVAADFRIAPGREKIVRFFVTWYFPFWRGSGSWLGTGVSYKHMYASRFDESKHRSDADFTNYCGAASDYIARNHDSLLKRIINWQQVIYAEKSLPVWLRDGLINNLYLITELGLWSQAQAPIGEWCRKEDGLFAISEDPRLCPQMECIPCSFYGNWPILYAFPQLSLSTLRAYKAYMQPSGAPPWIFGGTTGNTGGSDLIYPVEGYQLSLNGACLVDMVDRYWMATGDDTVLKELYPDVKKTTIWTMNLKAKNGPDYPDSLVSIYDNDWLECSAFKGMTVHVAGIHLAQLRQAERMAEKVGDKEFAAQCREWFKLASASTEGKLWAKDYYLNYYNPATGDKSDIVLGNQLDGEWMVALHGLPPVFEASRAKTALATVKRGCARLSDYGPIIFSSPDGTVLEHDAGYGQQAIFVAEAVMLAGTYMYRGDREFGLELARKLMNNMARKGILWDVPCFIDGSNGVAQNGHDYSQFGVLWTLPAAINNQDLAATCKPGGLVYRMLQAGKSAK